MQYQHKLHKKIRRSYIMPDTICLLRVIVVTVCLLLGNSVFAKPQTNIQQLTEKVQQLEKKDLLLEEKINTESRLNSSLSDSLQILKKQCNAISQNSKKAEFIPWTAFIIALVALLFVLLIFVKAHGLRSYVTNIFKECLNRSSRLSELKENIKNLQIDVNRLNRSDPVSNNDIQLIESRIDNLAESLLQIRNELNRIPVSSNIEPDYETVHVLAKAENLSPKKRGYAKINTGKYFTEILQSGNEVCVYKIDFVNDIKGEFDIVSLQKIQSRNDWQAVVEYSGNCTISEAQQYSVEEPGICEKKKGQNVWEVTKKLKIKISK